MGKKTFSYIFTKYLQGKKPIVMKSPIPPMSTNIQSIAKDQESLTPVCRPVNSGGTWEPSSEKLFSLRESFGPDFTHKSPKMKH